MSPDKIFWLVQSKGKFLSQYANNDNLKSQANAVWNQLDGITPILLCVAILVGIIVAAIYYTSFNENPGRHYKIKYWGLFFLSSVLVTAVLTIGLEYLLIKTNLNVAGLYMRCMASNATITLVVYFAVSFVWCNIFPTNACRFLKIR
jgi:uncharacterized membrane protein